MRFHQLDDATRRRFEDDGFLIVRGALAADEVAELIDAGERLIASDQVFDRTGAKDAAYDSFRNAIAHGGPAYERLLTHGPTVSIAAQLLSKNLQLHTSQLIWKRPEPGADPRALSPGWHRDIHTVTADLGEDAVQRFEVKIAYYLSPAHGRESGVTMVARGSHRWRGAPRFDAHRDPPDVVVPDLEPGDALLFENRTWHAAAVNTSAITRRCAIYGYSYRWMRPDDWVVQDPALVARLDPVGRDLVTPMCWRDRDGRFSLQPNIEALHGWFDQHRARGAAAAS
ncbi:MAG TPA: phytanoyl-CoA dioxygenase family protein [Planctomycetota bacterium]|nr:phytanoyl-CoA dioxygenase family protein [Planctomycetota bacterium]